MAWLDQGRRSDRIEAPKQGRKVAFIIAMYIHYKYKIKDVLCKLLALCNMRHRRARTRPINKTICGDSGGLGTDREIDISTCMRDESLNNFSLQATLETMDLFF